MNKIITAQDAQGLAFVTAQSYRINTQVIQTPYPQWAFNELIFVDSEGNPWAPGVATYTSDLSGKAEFVTGYMKDMPLADVSQDILLRSHNMVGIGYQYNIEEVNTALNVVGGTLSSRRAAAARMAYQKFMWDTTIVGQADKNLKGIANYTGVTPIAATNDGTSTSRYWPAKTPAQIIRDVNQALTGIDSATYGAMLADTLLIPDTAYSYIASTPFSATSDDTILSWILRTNLYTIRTGRPLTIRGLRELRNKSTVGTANKGRLVAYLNDPSVVKLHLPMPHQFLPVYQDGWANFVVPGIFRTGGVEILMPGTVYYLDAIVNDTDTGL